LIKRLIEDEESYVKYKAAALEKAEKFDMMVLANQLVEVYEQAIDPKNHNRIVKIETPSR
jgi:hypothetical protein